MEYKTTLTTCPYCGCGCQFYLESIDGRLVGTLPSRTSPTNRGKLCVKGWRVHEFVHSPRRLRRPLLRKGDELVDSCLASESGQLYLLLAQASGRHGNA